LSIFCSERRASVSVLFLLNAAGFNNAQAKADSSPDKAGFGMTGLRHPKKIVIPNGFM
jgi:hypothetical protein